MSKLTPHQELALITTGHMALTANAGSGKTFVLARKYLDGLINDKLEILSVAALHLRKKQRASSITKYLS